MYKKYNESQNKTIVYSATVDTICFVSGWHDCYVFARFELKGHVMCELMWNHMLKESHESCTHATHTLSQSIQ